MPAESDRQQAMDDPNLDLQECGVSDPKEAQRAWLERFRDRIEAVPESVPRAARAFRGSALLGPVRRTATRSRNARACAARGRLRLPTQ
jgi:hypothetical protein